MATRKKAPAKIELMGTEFQREILALELVNVTAFPKLEIVQTDVEGMSAIQFTDADGLQTRFTTPVPAAQAGAYLKAVDDAIDARQHAIFITRPEVVVANGVDVFSGVNGEADDVSNVYRKLTGRYWGRQATGSSFRKAYDAFRNEFALLKGLSAPPSGVLTRHVAPRLRDAETGCAAWGDPKMAEPLYVECVNEKGYHLWGGNHYFEWVDPTREDLPRDRETPVTEALLREAGKMGANELFVQDPHRSGPCACRRIERVSDREFIVRDADSVWLKDAKLVSVASRAMVSSSEISSRQRIVYGGENGQPSGEVSYLLPNGTRVDGPLKSSNTFFALNRFLEMEEYFPPQITKFPEVVTARQGEAEMIVDGYDAEQRAYLVTSESGQGFLSQRDLFKDWDVPSAKALKADVLMAFAEDCKRIKASRENNAAHSTTLHAVEP